MQAMMQVAVTEKKKGLVELVDPAALSSYEAVPTLSTKMCHRSSPTYLQPPPP